MNEVAGGSSGAQAYADGSDTGYLSVGVGGDANDGPDDDETYPSKGFGTVNLTGWQKLSDSNGYSVWQSSAVLFTSDLYSTGQLVHPKPIFPNDAGYGDSEAQVGTNPTPSFTAFIVVT